MQQKNHILLQNDIAYKRSEMDRQKKQIQKDTTEKPSNITERSSTQKKLNGSSQAANAERCRRKRIQCKISMKTKQKNHLIFNNKETVNK